MVCPELPHSRFQNDPYMNSGFKHNLGPSLAKRLNQNSLYQVFSSQSVIWLVYIKNKAINLFSLWNVYFSQYVELSQTSNLFFLLQQSIVKRNGYPLEQHTVITSDGYILTVYRLNDENSTETYRRQPVLIQHGIGGLAAFWVLQNRKSLGMFLP